MSTGTAPSISGGGIKVVVGSTSSESFSATASWATTGAGAEWRSFEDAGAAGRGGATGSGCTSCVAGCASVGVAAAGTGADGCSFATAGLATGGATAGTGGSGGGAGGVAGCAFGCAAVTLTGAVATVC